MLTNCKYQLNFNLIYGLLPEKRVARQNWTLTSNFEGFNILLKDDINLFFNKNDS